MPTSRKMRKDGKVIYIPKSESGKAGRGANGFSLSDSEIKKINDNVKSHSKSDNDRAERNTYNALQREKSVVENLDEYIRSGHIKSANDEWYQNHIEAYNSLSAKYKELQKARKKYNR